MLEAFVVNGECAKFIQEGLPTRHSWGAAGKPARGVVPAAVDLRPLDQSHGTLEGSAQLLVLAPAHAVHLGEKERREAVAVHLAVPVVKVPALLLVRQERMGAQLQRLDVGHHEARRVGEIPEQLTVLDKGGGVLALGTGELGQPILPAIDDRDGLALLVHAFVAEEDAEIKYSTVQNWYPGDENGKGGIYNFVTKRGECRGDRSKISWTQVETGSAITWKYPSVVLRGDDSVGEFYSVALTNNHQQADTGTKMVHLGKNTRSTIVSKGISAGQSSNAYRGLVRLNPGAKKARNYTQCDSLLIGEKCAAHTFPYIESRRLDGVVEHEATTSRVSDDQLFLCRQRGIDPEKAISMIVNGFCKDVFRELPMEFAVEAGKLLEVSLEGAVG